MEDIEKLKDLLKMMKVILKPEDSTTTREQRNVGFTRVTGIGISTCWTLDMGYETAVSKDSKIWYPVERYKDFADAVEGHQKWIGRIPELDEITTVAYGSLIKPETIKIRE